MSIHKLRTECERGADADPFLISREGHVSMKVHSTETLKTSAKHFDLEVVNSSEHKFETKAIHSNDAPRGPFFVYACR